MNQRATSYIGLFIVVCVVFGGAGLFYWIMSSVLSYVSSVQKEVVVALIAGCATVIVSTITVVMGRYFERKKERDALHREKKAQIYDEFLKDFFDHFFSSSQPDNAETYLVPLFREFQRKILLWSDPKTINSYLLWKEHLIKGTVDAQTVFLTEDLIFAIRKDLRHDNTGLKKGLFAKLFLQNPRLFLGLVKKNPNITLEEISFFEAMQQVSLDNQREMKTSDVLL